MLTNKKRKQIIAGIVAISMVTALTPGCGSEQQTTQGKEQTQQGMQDNGFWDNLATFGIGYALGNLLHINSSSSSSGSSSFTNDKKEKDKTIRPGYVPPATTTKGATSTSIENQKSSVTSKVPSAGSVKTGISSGSSRSSAVS